MLVQRPLLMLLVVILRQLCLRVEMQLFRALSVAPSVVAGRTVGAAVAATFAVDVVECARAALAAFALAASFVVGIVRSASAAFVDQTAASVFGPVVPCAGIVASSAEAWAAGPADVALLGNGGGLAVLAHFAFAIPCVAPAVAGDAAVALGVPAVAAVFVVGPR
ncbi:hypothetical protein CBR_g74912, partial [Chara braunii]